MFFGKKVFNEREALSPVAVLKLIPRPAKSLIIVSKTRLKGDKILHAKPTRFEAPGSFGAPLTATRIANRSMRVLSGALLLLLLTPLASSMVGWTESQPVVAPRADSGDSGETHHSHPNVYCKISALYGRTAKQPAPQWIEFYEPALEVAFDCFGEDRVVFGSDWPVSRTTGDYASLLQLTRKYVDRRGADASVKLFCMNAEDFYGIDAKKLGLSDHRPSHAEVSP